ncbi:hypothetical protein PCANC_04353 [Puccinia coronata f. sp. avenae]|uniref:Uncharacterized protein n=1 Tax=Puccinia coronata f. sp. avenae TaxID=200324 RepID=A0A2N5T8X9_9BASI|nr:hypothetical protein PCANC_04353 [Puccinia coronata f. sp. avenae]
MYQLSKRHSQQASTLPDLQEVLLASWYSTSLPGVSSNKLVLISAHQESPEYSVLACWGSSGKRSRLCVLSAKTPPAAPFQSPMLMKHGEIDDHQDFCPPSCHQLLRFQLPMLTKNGKITDHQDFCLPASPGQSAT